MQLQRRAESLLRKKVADSAQTQRALQTTLNQTQMSLEQLLTTIESDQFEIDADNQLHAKDVKTLASIRSSLGITYFDQFTARGF